MNETKIAWTNITWNPVHGCSKVSPGCDNCYAETLSLRMGFTKKPWTGENANENVQLKPHKLREPFKLKQPSRVFVNSMSDIFHPIIPDDYIAQVFAVMNDCSQHVFQILTKRPRRAAKWAGEWTENIWQGTSIESPKYLYRIDQLRECQAKTRFLSLEPLLEDLGELDLEVSTGSSLVVSLAKVIALWITPGRDPSVTSVSTKAWRFSSSNRLPTAPRWEQNFRNLMAAKRFGNNSLIPSHPPKHRSSPNR